MPILFQINTTIGRGSTGRIVEHIASLAKKEGWICLIAHGARFVGRSDMKSYQISSKVGEFIHFLVSRTLDRHGLGSYWATKSLIKLLESSKPDIVHIHNLHGYYINYELLLKYLAGKRIPTVITMHDFWLITGHCAYINMSCDKWEKGCGNCPRLREYPSALFDHSRKNWYLKKELIKAFVPNKLMIVPVSHWLESYARRSLLKESILNTIQNGINTEVFQPFIGEHTALFEGIDWSLHTILTVADRWTEANGFKDIIQLSSILPNDIQIVMVGLNEKQIQLLPSRIIGIRRTDNTKQLIELYTEADVLFNASREVTFGLVTAEAMACGTPAIVYKNTAGEEIIDQYTGFAVNSLQEIPSIVYECRKKADSFKDACRRRIVDNFNSVKQYSKYIDLYNTLLSQKH